MPNAEPFNAVDVIYAKRNNEQLSTEQINWIIEAYMRGYVAEEQMSALLMTIWLNGMGRKETRDLTLAMVNSGERMSFQHLSKRTTDKHSTGGVGDKITLPLAPLVASFGVAVPQLSGRGLGHTGGTLDKLESIPGWHASLSNDELFQQLTGVGAVVCAAGSGLAPADKRLYALRDVTATSDAIPLMASSIMSKKIAAGAESLVLDVKFGSGALLATLDDARVLARTMVELGEDAGVATSAFLTNMNEPLGRTIGNANEVSEAVEVLSGGGPDDVRALTVILATKMLALAGKTDVDVAAALDDGRALDMWRAMILAQGGDPDAELPKPKEQEVVTSTRDGVLIEQQALSFGIAAWRLGAGRARNEDSVQHAAGIDLHAKPGELVKTGQPLFTLSTDDAGHIPPALKALESAWRIGEPGEVMHDDRPLVADHIGR